MAKLYYTPAEAGGILGIGKAEVLDQIERPQLPSLRTSTGDVRIPIAAFGRWREGYRPRRRSASIAPGRRIIDAGAGERQP